MGWNDDVARLALEFSQFAEREAGSLALWWRFQHAQEAIVFRDVAHHEADEKTVVERRKLLFLGQLVAGAEESEQGHLRDFFTIVKTALIDKSQERVQDR